MADTTTSALHVKAHFKFRNQVIQIRRVGFEAQTSFEEFKQWLEQALKEHEAQLKPTVEQQANNHHHHHHRHQLHRQHPLFFLLGGAQVQQYEEAAKQAHAEQKKFAMKHTLHYVDNEHEWIQFGSELEWKEAVALALKHNGGVINLLIQIAFEPIQQPAKPKLTVEVKKVQDEASTTQESKPKQQSPDRAKNIHHFHHHHFNQANRSPQRGGKTNIRLIPILDGSENSSASNKQTTVSPTSVQQAQQQEATVEPSAPVQQQLSAEEPAPAVQNLSSSQLVDLVPAAERANTSSPIVQKQQAEEESLVLVAEPIYPSVAEELSNQKQNHVDQQILDESWDYIEVKSGDVNNKPNTSVAQAQAPAATLFPSVPSAPAPAQEAVVVVNTAAPVASQQQQQQDFTKELNILESMGFAQKQLNLHLLQFHKGNLQNVVLALIDFNEHAKTK